MKMRDFRPVYIVWLNVKYKVGNVRQTELLEKYGYPVETHEITTKDGYILTIHRVPYGKNSSTVPPGGRPVVVLDHGSLSTSANWVLSGPGKGLGYVFADAGYDVWLMNARGNFYSRKHIRYTTDELRFWEFGYHEMAIYDLPALIDTALNKTGQKQVYYAGYDLAGSKVLALLSTLTKYNAKIKLVSLMGPTVYGNNMRSPVRILGLPFYFESSFYELLGHGELIPELLVNLINRVAPQACTPEMGAAQVCQSAVFLIAGFDPYQTNYTLVPVVLGHQTSTSTKTIVHLLQSIANPTFRQFNYGVAGNMMRYNRLTPPSYRLSNVKVPVALYRGDNDLLADTRDINRLAESLPNVVVNYRVPFRYWNHVDFAEGIDAPTLVYKEVLSRMSQY